MILVTGGTGLLGSHLLVELAKRPEPVRALFRNKSRIDQVKRIFSYYFGEKQDQYFNKIEWVEGDILDIPSLEESMIGIETVYHCAALVSFARKDFYRLMKINREGTANVVNCCLLANIKTLCYVSSTAAIGGSSHNEVVTEETRWKQSPKTSGYSISKYSAEKEVWRGVEEGLDVVIVNPCLIFGPGSWEESSLKIFSSVDKGLKFYTDGKNAIVDARDVAEIMTRLVESKIRNERYLCTGEGVYFKDLTTRIAVKLNKKPPSIHTPKWLLGLTWRIAGIIAWFTRSTPTITRSSARSAFNKIEYDSSRIQKALSFKFRSLDETIDNAINGRLK